MKKYLFLFFALYGSIGIPRAGYARTDTAKVERSRVFALEPLNVGDTMPDLVLTNILNYSKSSFRIADFKDKVILIDFWATWCAACITTFPSNYELQKKYGDKLIIILVNTISTRDSEQKIKTFLDRRKAQYQFPCVVMDTVLNKLFPHHNIPHCVLIKNSKVIAITDADKITDNTITKILHNNAVDLAVKKDIRINIRHPLFETTKRGESPAFVFRSVLLNKIDQFESESGFVLSGRGQVSALRLFNSTVVSLYKSAYPEFSAFENTRSVFKVGLTKNGLLDSANKIGLNKAAFTYEAAFPPRTRTEVMEILRGDLDRFFNLRPDSEYRDTTCFVLKLRDHAEIPKAAVSEPSETNFYEKSNVKIYYTNKSINELTHSLEELYGVPFLNETGYSGNVTLTLPANPGNESELSEMLKKQGLILLRVRRRISFFTLSEKSIKP